MQKRKLKFKRVLFLTISQICNWRLTDIRYKTKYLKNLDVCKQTRVFKKSALFLWNFNKHKTNVLAIRWQGKRFRVARRCDLRILQCFQENSFSTHCETVIQVASRNITKHGKIILFSEETEQVYFEVLRYN